MAELHQHRVAQELLFSSLFNTKLPAEVKEATFSSSYRKFDSLSRRLARRRFLLDDALSVADRYLYAILDPRRQD